MALARNQEEFEKKVADEELQEREQEAGIVDELRQANNEERGNSKAQEEELEFPSEADDEEMNQKDEENEEEGTKDNGRKRKSVGGNVEERRGGCRHGEKGGNVVVQDTPLQ